jgi:hypothetical protein
MYYFNLHPEFCRRDTDKGADADFDKFITDLAKAPGAPFATIMKLQYEEFRIVCTVGNHILHSDMKDREPGVSTKGTCNLIFMSGSRHSSNPGLSSGE